MDSSEIFIACLILSMASSIKIYTVRRRQGISSTHPSPGAIFGTRVLASTPRPTTAAATMDRPTANTTMIASTATIINLTEFSGLSSVKITKGYRTSDTEKKLFPDLVFPRYKRTAALKEISENPSFPGSTIHKKETIDFDALDSTPDDSRSDFFDFRITTKRSTFLDPADRKIQESSGTIAESEVAHVWKPRRATSVHWGHIAEARSKPGSRKSIKDELHPIIMTSSDEDERALTRQVSTLNKVSSGTDHFLAVTVSGKSQVEDKRVSGTRLKRAFQAGHVSDTRKAIEKDLHKGFQVEPNQKKTTIRSVSKFTSRMPSRVGLSDFNIEPMRDIRVSKPVDIKTGGSVLIDEVQSKGNRSLAVKRSNTQTKHPTIDNTLNSLYVSLSSRKSAIVDSLEPLPNLYGNSNLYEERPRQPAIVEEPRRQPGINLPRSSAVRFGRYWSDTESPVLTREAIPRNRFSASESFQAPESIKTSAQQDFAPANAREREIIGRRPIPFDTRSGDAATLGPVLLGENANAVLRNSARSMELSPSGNLISPRKEQRSEDGFRLENSNDLLDSGLLSFLPDLLQATSMKPPPTTTFEKIEGCNLSPYEEDERYYLEYVIGFNSVVRPCPIGTVFRMRLCGCAVPKNGNMLPPLKCNIEFQLDFERGIKDTSGKNLFASSKNVHMETSAGRFAGNSYISIWRFHGAEFGDKMTIRVNFKQDGSQSNVQYLVGNCVSTGDPSISISLDPQRRKVLYRIVTYAYAQTVETSYKSDEWNDATLAYDGRLMQGITNGVLNSTRLEGKIQKRENPLKFGFCQPTNGFRGLLDYVQIYMCVPGRQEPVEQQEPTNFSL